MNFRKYINITYIYEIEIICFNDDIEMWPIKVIENQ